MLFDKTTQVPASCLVLPALFAITLLTSCASVEPPPAAPPSATAQRTLPDVHLDPAAATAMLSAYRASRGLGPVRLDPALTAMAQRQADAMAAANVLSHDVAGSFASRLAGAGLANVQAGENVGAGHLSLDDAFSSWRRSPGHDANLLTPLATRFGIAITENPASRFGVYWAMVVASDPAPRVAAMQPFAATFNDAGR